MSIIDYLVLFFAALAGAIAFLAVIGAVLLYRWWFGADRRESIDRDAPRVRTRIRQSPDWNGAA